MPFITVNEPLVTFSLYLVALNKQLAYLHKLH